MAPGFTLSMLPQRFPFCHPMMSYIKSQRTPTLHSKFIQTCQEFYVKDPIIVVEYVTIKIDIIELKFFEREEVFIHTNKLPFKLWITVELCLWQVPKKFLMPQTLGNFDYNWPILFKSIFRIENAHISCYVGKFKFSNLSELLNMGTCKELHIFYYDVIDDDNLQLPIEKIIELVPNVNSLAL